MMSIYEIGIDVSYQDSLSYLVRLVLIFQPIGILHEFFFNSTYGTVVLLFVFFLSSKQLRYCVYPFINVRTFVNFQTKQKKVFIAWYRTVTSPSINGRNINMGYFHNATEDGPLYIMPMIHIDLLHYVYFMSCGMFAFFIYLILPRGVRVQYCNSYPKYYARSSRYLAMKSKRNNQNQSINGMAGNDGHYWDNVIMTQSQNNAKYNNVYSSHHPNASGLEEGHEIPPSISLTGSRQNRSIYRNQSNGNSHIGNSNSRNSNESSSSSIHPSPIQPKILYGNNNNNNNYNNNNNKNNNNGNNNDRANSSIYSDTQPSSHHEPSSRHPDESIPPVSDVVVSATMQELRDPGLRLIAHGTKTKARGIWLQLYPTMLIWQTEVSQSKKKNNKSFSNESTSNASPSTSTNSSFSPKNNILRGKEHRVPLVDILYVDVGKHTDAFRKVENTSLLEDVCFSLLTKRGSLDLQTFDKVQRDALVSCFSLVLDEIHATKDWRNIHKAPSSEYPSSVDAPSGFDSMMRGGLVNSEC